jgi:hypothetical protein
MYVSYGTNSWYYRCWNDLFGCLDELVHIVVFILENVGRVDNSRPSLPSDTYTDAQTQTLGVE